MTTFKDIAFQILKETDKPLHSKEITRIALKKGLLKTSGKTPQATMASVLYTDVKEHGKNSRFRKTGPSTFGINPKFKEKKINEKKGSKSKNKPLSEREVQLAVLDYLYKIGWGTNPHIKQANEKGVDIRVQNNKAKSRYFFIETKGESKSKSAGSMSETAFVYSLGQLVTRMKVVDARYAYQYGLGLPKRSASIAIRRIPWQFARKVCLHIFSVDNNRKVVDYSWQDMKKMQKK